MQLKKLLDQYQPEDTHTYITRLVIASQHQTSPLVVKILAIIGSWITSWFFLFFLLVGLLQSAMAALIIGIVLFIVSIFLSQQTQEQAFLEGLAVSLNVTAQLLIIVGLMQDRVVMNFALLCLVMMALEVIVFILSAHTILQFGALLALQGFLIALFFNYQVYNIIHFVVAIDVCCLVMLWAHESQSVCLHPAITVRFSAISMALVVSLEMIFLTTIYNVYNMLPIFNWQYSTLSVGLGLIYFQYREWQRYGLGNERWYYLAVLVAIISLTAYSPGISAALLIVSVGYHRGHTPLLGMGMLFLAIFLIGFYYNLSINLLIKSGILFGTGLVCVGAAVLIKKYALR